MALDPFDVALGDIRETRRTRPELRRALLADALEADVDSRVPAGSEVVAEVVLEAFDGGIAVSGTVSGSWEGECRRCLTDVSGRLEVEVRELFRRGGGDDEGTYPMSEDHVKLREMVLDVLFTALPLLPLCRPGCLGLCALCGANRNEEACDCGQVVIDDRWSGLEILRGQLSSTAEDPRA